MRIIAFIEDYKVKRKILDYLGIFEFKRDRPVSQEVCSFKTHLMIMRKMII